MATRTVVELPLAHRADVNAKDIKGDTPLHFASQARNKGLADLLHQHGGRE